MHARTNLVWQFVVHGCRYGMKPRCGAVLAAAVLLGLLATPRALAENKLTDNAITSAVTEELLEDTAINSYLIDVSTSEGIVTLDGTTDNVLTKDRAVCLAEAIRGVRSVVNRIDISAPLRSDLEIREDVEDALL